MGPSQHTIDTSTVVWYKQSQNNSARYIIPKRSTILHVVQIDSAIDWPLSGLLVVGQDSQLISAESATSQCKWATNQPPTLEESGPKVQETEPLACPYLDMLEISWTMNKNVIKVWTIVSWPKLIKFPDTGMVKYFLYIGKKNLRYLRCTAVPAMLYCAMVATSGHQLTKCTIFRLPNFDNLSVII